MAHIDPIDEDDPQTRQWLDKLQGNILRGHGRDFVVCLFFTLKDRDSGRRTLRALAERYVTSARQQYDDTLAYRATRLPGALFGSLFLTAAGYRQLILDPETNFPEPAEPDPDKDDPKTWFVHGMKKAGDDLGDPHKLNWEEGYQKDVHAMLLLADDDERYLARKAGEAVQTIGHDTVRVCEFGRALRNQDGEGIEHFGHADGRSQPLFLKDDFAFEGGRRVRDRHGSSIDVWDPIAPRELVLIRDPFADEDCFGSFLVFRKLEQDVRGFHNREAQLTDALNLADGNRERAGALIIGRFRSGAPAVLSATGDHVRRHDNNFTYDQDKRARRCPFAAHIRKVNPRGDFVGRNPPQVSDRERRIVRRGITYGRRPDLAAGADPAQGPPASGVGLLFMCYQASIRRQFAFIQKRWLNNADFLISRVGVDPIVGRGKHADELQTWPRRPDSPDEDEFNCKLNVQGFVRLLGGEYFFAPSIPFLKSL